MDNLANLFSKIQNAQNLHKTVMQVPFSKKSWNICNILFIESLLKGFCLKDNYIYIFLKYSENKPVISKIKKISLQGRRLYTKRCRAEPRPVDAVMGRNFLPLNSTRNLHFYKLRILSTSKGIMTERDSQFLGIGGEILCDIL
jgi:small subunit ribosomal protein S8